ncbi:tyrosine-type recombinase/integrase [Actinokineospora enzanensis]|uniref:tyrosine-type recombinase/integrase n=1 Tax=Actinokineospora enzanensis TaxID=155975 RepID=UPI0009FD2BBC
MRNRAWNPFLVRAGFEWVTFRTFRKTVATLLDEAGLTARQVADLLGHARPSMTQDMYMGRGGPSRAAADTLDGVLGRSGE